MTSITFGQRIQGITATVHQAADAKDLTQQLNALGLRSAHTRLSAQQTVSDHYVMADGHSGFSLQIAPDQSVGFSQMTGYGSVLTDAQRRAIQNVGFKITTQANQHGIELVPNGLTWQIVASPFNKPSTVLDRPSLKRFDHVAVVCRDANSRQKFIRLLNVLRFFPPGLNSHYDLGTEAKKNQLRVEVFQHADTKSTINLVWTKPGHVSVLDNFMAKKSNPPFAIHHTGVLVAGPSLKTKNPLGAIERVLAIFRQRYTGAFSQPLDVKPAESVENGGLLRQLFLSPMSAGPFGSFIELVERHGSSQGFTQPNSEQLRQNLLKTPA